MNKALEARRVAQMEPRIIIGYLKQKLQTELESALNDDGDEMPKIYMARALSAIIKDLELPSE